jgi:hypothetical protein
MDLVTATDLERWAEFRDAQARLPQLIRRLISSTAHGLTAFSLRAGEGIQLPGWDGVVVAQHTDAHVPAGVSAWEMGVNKDPADKANDDYNKRTNDPGDIVPSESTFVFVTPRRWQRKDDWMSRKKKQGVWKSVIAYDADDIETWLERSPEVHAWLSSLLGKDPYEAESLETWWESWSGATRPPMPPSVLLSGRDETAQHIRDALARTPDVLSLSGDSQEEVVALIAAVLLSTSDDGAASAMRRTLIVRSPRAWRRLAVTDHPLILLPLYDKPDVVLATQYGHHVLVPFGRDIGANSETEIPRLRRDGIERALIDAGLARERASKLATLGRRSLLSFRRVLAVSPEVQAPEWSRPEHARAIIPAILAGTWKDDVTGDCEAIAALAGRPYSEIVQDLTRWANTSDPPIRRVGNVWIVAAKQDAWMLIARSLTADDIARFRQCVRLVIGGDDPSLDLAPRQRIMASILGKERPHSSHLITGLADTIALMAALSEQVPLVHARRGQEEADVIVHTLLDEANSDSSGRRWTTVSSALPLLAEAAPDRFLSAVEAGLNGDDPVVLKLFQDGNDFEALFSHSPHTALLWALENLAWSPDYLGRAVLVLAKLSRLEPGGRLGNRPSNSLREILILWRPGTAATLEQRLQVIDVVRQREPGVAWHLLLDLIPSGHDTAGWPHGPTWRDWKPDTDYGIPYIELHRAVEGVAARALEDVNIDGRRWAELLYRVPDVTPSIRNDVIETLQKLHPNDIGDEGRVALLRTLRELVGRHRQYPDTDWAIPSRDVDRLAEMIPLFEPADMVAKHSWLFDQGASHLLNNENHHVRHQVLVDAQAKAVLEVYEHGGLTTVLRWSEHLNSPSGTSQLGYALGKIEVADTIKDELYNTLLSDVDAHRQVARSYIYQMLINQASEWLSWGRATIHAKRNDWTPPQQAEFLSVFPATKQMWNLVDELGDETSREYWQRIHIYSLAEEGDVYVYAARQLLKHGKPYMAIEILDNYARTNVPEPPDDVVAAALEQAAQASPSADVTSTFSDSVGRHLDRLATNGFDEERLAMLEWMYLPLFRHYKRRSAMLHRTLASDPAFFVQMVSWAYRAKGEEPKELTADERQRAENAHALLMSWRIVPGTKDDGTIDVNILRDWISTARSLLVDCGRITIGDQCIGQVLRYGPSPDEDIWPTIPIRTIIEEVASENIELGLQVEVHNSRGITSRLPGDGGQQERDLVQRYYRYASSAQIMYPRTAGMLKEIAASYGREARRHDIEADLNEDLSR